MKILNFIILFFGIFKFNFCVKFKTIESVSQEQNKIGINCSNGGEMQVLNGSIDINSQNIKLNSETNPKTLEYTE